MQSSFEVVTFLINKQENSRNADAFREFFVKLSEKGAVQNHFITMAHRPLECFAVLNRRFFFTAATGDRVNTGCIPRETGAVVEEKIHSKPCKSLCESALPIRLFCK